MNKNTSKEEMNYIEYKVELEKMTMTGKCFEKLLNIKQYGQIEELEEHKGYDRRLDKYYYADVANAYIFRELVEKLGRIPTQREFVREANRRIFNEWIKKSKYSKNKRTREIYKELLNDPIMKNTVHNRNKRTYMGFIAEWHLLATIKSNFKDVIIMRSPYVDVRLNIDFIVIFVNEGKVINIHSTSDSKKSQYYLNRKSNNSADEFAGDLFFGYSSTRTTNESTLVNSFPIYDENYVVHTLINALSDPEIGSKFDGSKLQEYMAALKPKFAWDKTSGWELYRSDEVTNKNKEKYERSVDFFMNYGMRIDRERMKVENRKEIYAYA